MDQKEFFGLLNTRVFEPTLGRCLSFQECKHVVDGIADVIVEVTMDGMSLRFGKMGTFKRKVIASCQRWDPQRKKKFMAPEKRRLIFNVSKSTQRLFAIF